MKVIEGCRVNPRTGSSAAAVTNIRTSLKVIPSLRPLETSRMYFTNKAYTFFSLR